MNYTFAQLCLKIPIMEAHTYTFKSPFLMTMSTTVLQSSPELKLLLCYPNVQTPRRWYLSFAFY